LSHDTVDIDEPIREKVYPEYPDKITPEFACGYTWDEIFEKRKSMAHGERVDYPLLYVWVKLYLDFWYKGDYQYIGDGVYGREPEGNVWNKRILPIIMACSSFDQGKEFYWQPMLHIEKKGEQFWLEYNWVQYPYGKMDYEWLFKSLSGQGFKEYVCSEISYDEFNTGNYKIYVTNFPGMSEKFDEYAFSWSGDSYDDGNGYLSEVFCDAEELWKIYVEVSKIMYEKGMIDWIAE